MTVVVLLMLVVLAVLSLQLHDLLNAVICLAVFSLLSALLFYLFMAPDVAVAEAAIGAGIGTIIFIWIIKRTQRWEEK
jgi:energy-converting hydrogenase B subunit D